MTSNNDDLSRLLEFGVLLYAQSEKLVHYMGIGFAGSSDFGRQEQIVTGQSRCRESAESDFDAVGAVFDCLADDQAGITAIDSMESTGGTNYPPCELDQYSWTAPRTGLMVRA